jgi:hypothetical protein
LKYRKRYLLIYSKYSQGSDDKDLFISFSPESIKSGAFKTWLLLITNLGRTEANLSV